MTLFVNFRTSPVGGDIVEDPYVLDGDGLQDPVQLRTVGWTIPPARVAGRHVVFATHGFNVSYRAGVHVLAQLEQTLALGDAFLFVGVLWPGDYWIPVINYPAEASDAVRCGQLLAGLVNRTLSGASAVSFVSHSLGGRLIFEAVAHLDAPADQVCVLAAAVDDNCLSTRQYSIVRANARRVSVLASTEDLVLRLAYPLGDFAADVAFDGDDSPWRGALGYRGPRPSRVDRVEARQIDPANHIGHLEYLPSAGGLVEGYVREVLHGLPPTWPN